MKKALVVLLLVLAITTQAKRKPSLKKADAYFAKTEYVKAKEEYTRLLRGRHTPNYINQQLALCYDQLGLSVQAANFYATALGKDPALNNEFYYRLAYNLTKNGRYEAAKSAMQKFAYGAKEDARVLYFLKHTEDYPLAGKKPSVYFVEESGINDPFYADYSVSWTTTTDTLLFVSNRTKYSSNWMRRLFEVRQKGTAMPNSGIYQTTLTSKDIPLYEHSLLRGPINRRFQEGQAVMHPSGKLIYFTSESYRNRKFRKNKEVKQRQGMMSLFSAERKRKKWKKVKVLPFVQEGFTYVNPFVTAKGDYLYFASNQPGTIGGLDLWRVAILEEGKAFGEPENLGEHINTGYEEDYPFVSEDEVLYFTSDRWGGYGGLDIYALDLKNKDAQPQNLGEGINTPKDDFNWVYNSKREYGFLSTNRIGRMDIYRVKPICETQWHGVVIDGETQEVLHGVKIELADISRQVIAKAQTTSKGEFTVLLPCDKAYVAKVEKEGYFYKEQEFRSKKEEGESSVIALKKQVKPEVENNKIMLNAIPFAFDQAEITAWGKRELDRLVAFMKENTTMRILIKAHTDQVGKERYNKKLSQARAEATAQYVFEQGIAPNRVETQGVGSTNPKVVCKVCTEAENQQNRRSEFIILQP